MGLRQLVINATSWLRYKPVFADATYGRPDRYTFPGAARGWVPDEDRERLAAYTLLAAYDHNQAGELARVFDVAAEDRIEMGDPSMIVDTLVAHVLGREQQITVPGAEDDAPDGEAPDPVAAHAAAVQERLRQWATDEIFPMRVQQCERKTVLQGHGVYLAALDSTKRRPRISVIDPGFYFPVLAETAGDGGDYPTTVHLAWEIPADLTKPGDKTKVRRITYELGPIGGLTTSVTDGPRPGRTTLLGDDGTPVFLSGDTVNESGAVTRQYPWNDVPSAVTCYLTDATWLLEDIKGTLDVYSLDPAYSTPAVRADGQVLERLDLQLDFLPIVDIPNTVPDDGHWGVSSLARILQGIDALQAADTDSSAASATTGLSPIALWGQQIDPGKGGFRMGPGAVFTLGEGGGMTAVDTSKNLAELRNHKNDLRDRIATTARIPTVALGTSDPAQFPSGYALQLALGPLDSLVASMRLARAHKYGLLLKFVQRLFIAGGIDGWAGPVVPAEFTFGSYTPTDRAGTLVEVSTGFAAGLLSLETGVRMLQEAGFPIDDIGEEITRIQSRQFDQATALANATGDQGAVADFLGTAAPTVQAPAPVLPPAGPAAPPGPAPAVP